MAPPDRRTNPSVADAFWQDPCAFDFFQAVNLLERMAKSTTGQGAEPARGAVGGDYDPGSECVNFRSMLSHSFPASSVAAMRPAGAAASPSGNSTPPEMTVSFLGLTGPKGVLPQHYTQLVIDRTRVGDESFRDFLDVFNHRSISLFYRAWEKYRFWIGYERHRRDSTLPKDLFTQAFNCLVGMGGSALRDRLEIDDELFLYYGGLFTQFPRNAISLEQIVGDFFEIPVEVRQFQGQWLKLDPEHDQALLPTLERPEGQYSRLGQDAIVGERVWSADSKFRLRLGPLSYAEFERYTPAGDRLVPLCQLVRMYVNPELDFEVQLILRKEEAPPCYMGSSAKPSPMLGWDTWFTSEHFSEDLEDAVFTSTGLPTR